MDLKNLPITPLPLVKLDKHQEDLLVHNELFATLLGETIFRYAGLHIYEVTEKLKEASRKYYKTQKQEARKNLSSFCSDLTDAEILRVIRGFSIFSALANIAEDVYQTHEQRYAKISNKPQIGSLEKSLKNLKKKGISQDKILKAMEKVSIVPVLTAHPTQVQRKSILDLTKKLTDLLDKYENVKSHQIDENEEFLALLRDVFKIDGLLGQLFVVTHSTDALVDDYRHIIRLYRDENNMVCAACGVTFNFPKEVEKHLIMHFPEAKEALYARCIIIVEGETEYGSFAGFGKRLGVDFDYFGICLINARGESSISKLQKLFNRFSIPTVALYDRDVEGKYAKAHSNIFYTQEICFEMDFVSYLLAMQKRSIMDAIIKDIIDDARPMVTKDMARRGYAKLGITKSQIVQRCLSNISDRKLDDLHIYYFSWFYANKGVIVGRRISQFLDASMIPPAFIAVIERAKLLSLGLG